jgi:hypothetical protein
MVELKAVQALRAGRPARIRRAPTPTETNRDQTFLVLSELLVRIRPADE